MIDMLKCKNLKKFKGFIQLLTFNAFGVVAFAFGVVAFEVPNAPHYFSCVAFAIQTLH